MVIEPMLIEQHRSEFSLITRLRGRAWIPGVHHAAQTEAWMSEAADRFVSMLNQLDEIAEQIDDPYAKGLIVGWTGGFRSSLGLPMDGSCDDPGAHR